MNEEEMNMSLDTYTALIDLVRVFPNLFAGLPHQPLRVSLGLISTEH